MKDTKKKRRMIIILIALFIYLSQVDIDNVIKFIKNLLKN